VRGGVGEVGAALRQRTSNIQLRTSNGEGEGSEIFDFRFSIFDLGWARMAVVAGRRGDFELVNYGKAR
jgi:hypothetical protein